MHIQSILKSFNTLVVTLKIPSLVVGLIALAFGLLWPLCLFAGEKALDEMSVQEKVGQLMVWAYPGTQFDSALQSTLKTYNVGSFIAFARNIKTLRQAAKFNRDAQNFASRLGHPPLFLMIDQEGGTVNRIRFSPPLPSALSLGALNDSRFIENYAYKKAQLLLALGFNVNLAPVLDVSDPSAPSFMGNRVFSGIPIQASDFANAYAEGISRAGGLPIAKHFPGHGGPIADSHKSLPQKLATLEELEQNDLIPFKAFAKKKFPRGIMTAHLSLPNIELSGNPATFSSVLLQDLLRKKYGYDGLVLTDDLEMSGAGVVDNVGERAVKAFLAGNDLLMIAGPLKDQALAANALIQAVERGRISVARLNESVERILQVKHRLASVTKPKRDPLKLKRSLERLAEEALRRNFDGAVKPSPLASSSSFEVLSADTRFFRNFANSVNGKVSFVHLKPSQLIRGRLNSTEDLTRIFYVSGSGSAKLLRELPSNLARKTIVVNCSYAGQIDNPQRYQAVLDLKSPSPDSGKWLAELLTNRKPLPPKIRQPANQ